MPNRIELTFVHKFQIELSDPPDVPIPVEYKAQMSSFFSTTFTIKTTFNPTTKASLLGLS